MTHRTAIHRPLAGTALLAALTAGAGCGVPLEQSTQGWIGIAGGTITLDRGVAVGAAVVVPPNALSRTTLVSIRENLSGLNPPTQARPAGPVVVFGPDGTRFDNPVMIVVPITTPSATSMYTRPSAAMPWAPVTEAMFDVNRHAMVAWVTHFSEFVSTTGDSVDGGANDAAANDATANDATANDAAASDR